MANFSAIRVRVSSSVAAFNAAINPIRSKSYLSLSFSKSFLALILAFSSVRNLFNAWIRFNSVASANFVADPACPKGVPP